MSMSKPIFFGQKFVFGVPDETRPLRNPPPGRQRFRFRNGQPAFVFIKGQAVFWKFALVDLDTEWGLIAQAKNSRTRGAMT
jgi:hypothetical protein